LGNGVIVQFNKLKQEFISLIFAKFYHRKLVNMKVYKFGGASINSLDRIKIVANIVRDAKDENLVLVISAMGKTTNALEKVVDAFFAGNNQMALDLFHVIKENHITTAKYLLVTTYNATIEYLANFFTEVEWLLHDKPVKSYDYYYDQVICIGEMLSSSIVSAYLNEVGIANKWIDVRDVIRTDNNFRDAKVDWEVTKERLVVGGWPLAEEKLMVGSWPLVKENNNIVDEQTGSAKQLQTTNNKQQTSSTTTNQQPPTILITQGFVGSTDENESTTLGREGSDYSAAIFANLLNAESLTIWKDVTGVMSADPAVFNDAVLISDLSFPEVIEMAYYGAQVIHPKTIKPLQNKNIPLHVKSFIDPTLAGTTIGGKSAKNLPPIRVIKQNQVLINLRSHDFSFVGERLIRKLYEIFEAIRTNPNLIQTGAIGLQVCLDNHPEKIDLFAIAAAEDFDVQIEKGLSLLTIRHYSEEVLNTMTAGKDVVLVQKTKETLQIVYR
jgi:aspartate kinase